MVIFFKHIRTWFILSARVVVSSVEKTVNLEAEKHEFMTYMFFDILQEILYFTFLNHQWS